MMIMIIMIIIMIIVVMHGDHRPLCFRNFPFKLVNFSQSYTTKQNLVFFSEHGVCI